MSRRRHDLSSASATGGIPAADAMILVAKSCASILGSPKLLSTCRGGDVRRLDPHFINQRW